MSDPLLGLLRSSVNEALAQVSVYSGVGNVQMLVLGF